MSHRQHIPVAAVLFLSIAAPAAAQTTLPPGDGREIVARMCGTGCHRIEVVITHRYTDEGWAQSVDNMVTRGAKGTDREIEAAIRYLSQHFGRPPIGGGARTAPTPSSTPGREAAAPSARAKTSADSKTVVIPENEWRFYGHDSGGRRYSPLKQINPQNVASNTTLPAG